MTTKLIKNIVKNLRWQKTRKQLLGKWSSEPEWCCQQLRKFLGNISTTSEDNLRTIVNHIDLYYSQNFILKSSN